MLTQLETRTDLQTITTDPELEDDEPIMSHIIVESEGKTPAATVTEAMVMGTPLTALCGKVWVPSRNPQNHPVCPTCVDMYKLKKSLE